MERKSTRKNKCKKNNYYQKSTIFLESRVILKYSNVSMCQRKWLIYGLGSYFFVFFSNYKWIF